MAKKQVIRLTECDLNRIIKESVKHILKENCWYGNEEPFIKIINAAEEIIKSLEYVNDEDYEECGDDYSYGKMYNWAIKVKDDAEYFLRENSSNVSINGGENW